jgi:lysine 6-dehydrogenase
MKILLLGVGMQGKAALHDLVNSPNVSEIIAADKNIDDLNLYVKSRNYGSKVQCHQIDAENPETIKILLTQKPDVVIDLLPTPLMDSVAALVVEHGIHLVNTFYTSPKLEQLSKLAEAKNISILPEFGMDPGIDLVLLGQATRSFDEVFELNTYGAGFPEPKAANNPLKYKVTWTFEGVLRAYRRTGFIVKNGKVVEIKDNEMFKPKNRHEVEDDSLGKLEAYPNGDATKYLELLKLDISKIKQMGRYALRWPGHCDIWENLVDLHLLDDEPVIVDGLEVNRRRFLANVIEPQIQLGDNERDITIIRIDIKGNKDGKESSEIYQVIDYRDLETGLTSMSRTVGFTASIGAQMLGRGQIKKRGLLSPVNDVPYKLFLDELKKRNINVEVKTV